MSQFPKGRRIVWLVHILTVVGLAMVVTTTSLVGWTLNAMRCERTHAMAEQSRLDAAASRIRERAGASQAEIRFKLDETSTHQFEEPSAVENFTVLVRSQLNAPVNPTVRPALVELRDQCAGLGDIGQRATAWRARYLAVWEDLRAQRTMNRVRQIIDQLRGDMEAVEGRRRLEGAIAHRQWRHASGEEAARLARAILIIEGQQQSKGGSDFKSQLAEMARLVELLGGEEQYDHLTDLKDNKLRPVIDRLMVGAPNAQSIEDLKRALFGDGYRVDEAHQNIVVGRGGLFTLRRDALQLRREREILKNELAVAMAELESANALFAKSTHLRSAELTRQMEKSLAAGWNRMLFFGVGCAVVFLWLAWRITRGIDGQVHAIEQARAEAESSRQRAQHLMQEQQKAAGELREAHAGLQASEERFRTLSASAPIGIFLTDPAGDALYLNQHWLGIAQRPLEDCLGEAWKQAVHPDDVEAVFVAWKETALAGREFSREFRFHTPSGEDRWVSSHAVAIRSKDGELTGYVGTTEDITTRKLAEAELKAMHGKLLETSRQAGMAEVATSVLHNVGNVLNSVNIASACVAEHLRNSKAASLVRIVAMLREHEADLGAFFTNDARARQLPGFLAQLSDRLVAERAKGLEELAHLQKNIEHIRDIVAMQQTYAKVSGLTETIQVAELVEDTLRMSEESLASHNVRIVREFSDVPPVTVEKHKVLQILVNLVRNAKHACEAAEGPDKMVTVRVYNGDGTVKVAVADNGVGIPAENLARVFNHGFTTKKDGHGFGLHSGALAAREVGGSLRAESKGSGQGSTFTLELPIEREKGEVQ
jgi:PAS domain S-box-containing protein